MNNETDPRRIRGRFQALYGPTETLNVQEAKPPYGHHHLAHPNFHLKRMQLVLLR